MRGEMMLFHLSVCVCVPSGAAASRPEREDLPIVGALLDLIVALRHRCDEHVQQ